MAGGLWRYPAPATGRPSAGRLYALAGPVLAHADDLHHAPDDVRAGHNAPYARVAGLGAVVAHHEVGVGRDVDWRLGLEVAPVELDVRLLQRLAADVDGAVLLGPGLPRQSDHALDEPPACAALDGGVRRC